MRKFVLFLSICLLTTGAMLARPATAATTPLSTKLSGYILLQVQRNGETWYVYPVNKLRYYLGNPSDAFRVMRQLALGISNADLAKIPVAGSSSQGDLTLRHKLSGRILLQVERNGETWYVDPRSLQRYSLGNPSEAFQVMRSRSLGITNKDLATISVAPGFGGPAAVAKPIEGVLGDQKSIVSSHGTYAVDFLSFDRSDPKLKLTIDTAVTKDCANNCPAYPLETYMKRRTGIAGMHGAYACPPDYAACAGQTNFYYAPIYNSYDKVMINAGRIKYTSEPLVAIDTDNRLFFYKQALQFTSYQDFLNHFTADSLAAGGTGVLQAAISNHPPLIINGANVVSQYKLDTKQATAKSYRGVLAWKGNTVYLAVVHGATVTDAAAVMEAMGMDFALNLDGGGSTALYQNGGYTLGPGRNLTNVFIINRR